MTGKPWTIQKQKQGSAAQRGVSFPHKVSDC